MKKHKHIAFLLVLVLSLAYGLTGCGESNTIAGYIISDQQYRDRKDLENATQPERLFTGKDIYASVYFIESPKGMEYTAKWFINGHEVKKDTQKMPTDKKGLIVFYLERDLVSAGTLKFEVSYGGAILASKELVIDEK